MTKNNMQLSTDIVEMQTRMAREKMAEATKTIFEELVVKPQAEKKQMPENVFKDYFYPYFSGERKLDENKNIMAEWVAIAGSPMAEVTVVDEKGQPQFDVPPIYDSSIIETVKHNIGESFGEIYNQYNLHSKNLPVLGERYLANAFNNKIPKMIKGSEVVNVNAAKWKTIFDRYGSKDNAALTSINSHLSRDNEEVEGYD